MDETQPRPSDLAWMRAAAGANPVPEWTGDLSDDCTAHWAGLMLRAEKMENRGWWWAVSLATGVEIASSNDSGIYPAGGKKAREAALRAARSYLDSNPSPARGVGLERNEPIPGRTPQPVLF